MQQLAACRGNHSYLRTETILPYNVECKEQVCACMRYLCEWCEYIASTSHPLPCRVFESDLSTDWWYSLTPSLPHTLPCVAYIKEGRNKRSNSTSIKTPSINKRNHGAVAPCFSFYALTLRDCCVQTQRMEEVCPTQIGWHILWEEWSIINRPECGLTSWGAEVQASEAEERRSRQDQCTVAMWRVVRWCWVEWEVTNDTIINSTRYSWMNAQETGNQDYLRTRGQLINNGRRMPYVSSTDDRPRCVHVKGVSLIRLSSAYRYILQYGPANKKHL